jgi:hypothetical protein
MEPVNDRLNAFVYILIRDYLTLGQINSIIRDHVEKAAKNSPVYSSKAIKYCVDDIVNQLIPPVPEEIFK